MSKRLGGIIGCKDQTSSWHLIEFPHGSNIEQILSSRGKPPLNMYTYINHHAGTQPGLQLICYIASWIGLLLLLSSHMLFAWERISRYIVKDAPAGVTTVERPHILPTAVHALDFLSREGSGPPYPSSTLRSNFVYPRQISRSPRAGHCMS